LAAAATIAFGLAGCGGDDERERVADYIRDANAIQREAAPRFTRANQAYLAFSKGELAPADASKRLASAERAIRATRDDLAELDPPADARRLHTRLLALLDADADFARESTLLARYVPASARAVRPLPRLGRRLRAGLSRQVPQTQARALGAYADGIAAVLDDLRPLEPPPVLFERHGAEVRRLAAVETLARRLRGALRARDSQRLAQLLQRFRRVNGRQRGVARFQRLAVAAYNRRYRGLRRAQQEVARERRELERRLG